ncbi:MAG: ATP-binding protein [Hyphomicrobiaceae bacterium]
MSWSSGKDSAWALHMLRQSPAIEIAGLLVTVNEAFDRVAMHGVRRRLVEAQARAAGLPLHVVTIPYPCPNEVYEARMAAFVGEARGAGICAIAFGDLFLEDIRAYREQRLHGTGLVPLFPLWGRTTSELADEMIDGGLRARIVCLDPRQLDAAFVGRDFDRRLLSDLPAGVDPCGERGEFHTFACAGPMFSQRIPIASGATVERDGFVFADVELCEDIQTELDKGAAGHPG